MNRSAPNACFRGLTHGRTFRGLAGVAGLVLPAAALAAVTGVPAGATILRPVVLSVRPARGWVTGGTAITITGKRFTSGTTVKLAQGSGPGPNAIPAANIKVISSTKITAVTGRAAKVGSYNVFVTTKAGTSAAATADKYSYLAASAWHAPTHSPRQVLPWGNLHRERPPSPLVLRLGSLCSPA